MVRKGRKGRMKRDENLGGKGGRVGITGGGLSFRTVFLAAH